MSKSKFVNIDELGNLAASSSSDALLQKVIAELAEYKRINNVEVKNLKDSIKKLQETCVKYKEGLHFKMGEGDNPVSIYGGSQCRLSYCDSPAYGGHIFKMFKPS